MTEATVPKQFDTLVFNALNVYGKTEYFCQQYKITSYTYKQVGGGFGGVIVEGPRWWAAYYILPIKKWGEYVVRRQFETAEAAMKACQIAWEHSGHAEVDINAYGVECYESLRDKHEKLNRERKN
tara:strand:+ start:187 stop:561 length:375 start_codon:yes stop_codon:yes gene_type:complete